MMINQEIILTNNQCYLDTKNTRIFGISKVIKEEYIIKVFVNDSIVALLDSNITFYIIDNQNKNYAFFKGRNNYTLSPFFLDGFKCIN